MQHGHQKQAVKFILAAKKTRQVIRICLHFSDMHLEDNQEDMHQATDKMSFPCQPMWKHISTGCTFLIQPVHLRHNLGGGINPSH